MKVPFIVKQALHAVRIWYWGRLGGSRMSLRTMWNIAALYVGRKA